MSTRLVVFPRGQLGSKDKERMTKMGIAWAEADDPRLVVEVARTAPLVSTAITGDGIVMAALAAMQGQYAKEECHTFVKHLYAALQRSEQKASQADSRSNQQGEAA